jgi:hypothetical protein
MTNYTYEGLIQLGFEWEIDFCIYEDYGLVWKSGKPQPTEEECVAAKAEYDANQYQRDRAAAYSSLGDQMDMQYWDALNDTTTWADHVKDIKTSYPK